MATGEKRGGICLTESNAGTDLQNIAPPRRATARLSHQRLEDVDHQRPARRYVPASGQDRPALQPAHRGMSAFVIEKGAPGMTVSRDIDKLGYKASKPANCIFRISRCPPKT
jgi:alkylation response protein AidB-like acyl-CoA dehydrogenase